MAVKQTFEKALDSLEKIVRELEDGDLPLEKAQKKFEQGMELSRYCEKTLDETEKKIAVLIEKADGSVSGTDPETPDGDIPF